MGCKGLHCDGCHNHGSGPAGPAAAVAVLLVFVALGVHKAWPQVVQATQIVGWTLAGIAGATIMVTGTVVTARVVRARRAARPVTRGRYLPGYRITPGQAPPAIGGAKRPAWLYGPGCCEHWTREHGCSAGHTGRSAMPLRARYNEWPDRRGQR